jgi:hypothetical protein
MAQWLGVGSFFPLWFTMMVLGFPRLMWYVPRLDTFIAGILHAWTQPRWVLKEGPRDHPAVQRYLTSGGMDLWAYDVYSSDGISSVCLPLPTWECPVVLSSKFLIPLKRISLSIEWLDVGSSVAMEPGCHGTLNCACTNLLRMTTSHSAGDQKEWAWLGRVWPTQPVQFPCYLPPWNKLPKSCHHISILKTQFHFGKVPVANAQV